MNKTIKTVCVADIAQTVSLRKIYDEKQLMDHLQNFYEVMGDIITDYKGKIINYNFGEIIYLFNKPNDAYSCSRDMVDVYLKDFKKGDDELFVSIATGEILEVEIGHSSYRINDVYGDAVNEAYKSLKKAKTSDDNIIVCEVTAGKLDTDSIFSQVFTKFLKKRKF